MHAASDYKHIPFDYDYCMQLALRAVNTPEIYARLSLNEDGDCTGLISGEVQQFMFSPRIFAMETAWYVQPDVELRASIACKLMRGFIDWALHDWNCAHVLSSDTANIAPTGVDALHRQLGFRRCGSVFIYDGAVKEQ